MQDELWWPVDEERQAQMDLMLYRLTLDPPPRERIEITSVEFVEKVLIGSLLNDSTRRDDVPRLAPKTFPLRAQIGQAAAWPPLTLLRIRRFCVSVGLWRQDSLDPGPHTPTKVTIATRRRSSLCVHLASGIRPCPRALLIVLRRSPQPRKRPTGGTRDGGADAQHHPN
jgi:hypothetical protein